jgi:hypothetical protein
MVDIRSIFQIASETERQHASSLGGIVKCFGQSFDFRSKIVSLARESTRRAVLEVYRFHEFCRTKLDVSTEELLKGRLHTLVRHVGKP